MHGESEGSRPAAASDGVGLLGLLIHHESPMTTCITCVPIPPSPLPPMLHQWCGITHPHTAFCPFRVLEIPSGVESCCTFAADNAASVLEKIAPDLLERLARDMSPEEARQFAIDLNGVWARFPGLEHKWAADVERLGPAVLWFSIVSALGFGVRAALNGEQ
jgi:hypothetical protein